MSARAKRPRRQHEDPTFRLIAGNILKLLPETSTLAVVQGNSRIERIWFDETRKELAPLAARVKLVWLHDLTLAQLRERVAALPPRSAVLYTLLPVDVNGVPYENERALAEVLAAAKVPVFGAYDSQLGEGIVGGPVDRNAQDGRAVGTDCAAACWRGERRPNAANLVLEVVPAGLRLAGARPLAASRSRGCRPAPRCASGRLRCGSSTGC